MITAKPMIEVSVEEILNQYNLIVPEIQREYVWGLNQYGIFDAFLEDIKEGFQVEGEVSPEMKSLQSTIENPLLDDATRKNLFTLLDRMRKPIPSMNIGFLYSYKPGYYIGEDREEDLYLIDGQQRFTTLFLILFYFSLKENRKEDFICLFKFNAAKEKIAFDYRVRSITHQFIIDLISKSETLEDLSSIHEKGWFLANYAMDTTVKSITGYDEKTGVFNLLRIFFEDDTNQYFNFIKSDIKFWHFKTEETSQGEELYITMNSRGQQLADNETIRAKLFDNDEVRENSIYWSEQWELWQDYFWKHRNKVKKGITADEGFNEFLRWVQILEMWERFFKAKTASPDSIKTFEKTLQWEAGSKLIVDYFSLSDIELTFKALHFLFEKFAINQNQFKILYKKSHSDNLIPGDWIAPTDNAINLINLFQLLPILQYCKKCIKNQQEIDELKLYRIIRMIRTLSKDKTIGKAIRNQIANVLYFSDELMPNQDLAEIRESNRISKTILNEEVVSKLTLFATVPARERIEDLTWFAEELRYNSGEVLHLFNCAKTINSDTSYFNVENFEKVILTLDEFMKNEESISGNIIHTDCYIESHDRIGFHSQWYKREGLMNLIKLRISEPPQTLQNFLVGQQKNFIRQYHSVDQLSMEMDSKKQVYVYYILTVNNIAASFLYWQWNDCYNFGKINPEYGDNILFETGYIFQLFKSNFTINSIRNLEIHQYPFKDALQKLFSWAN